MFYKEQNPNVPWKQASAATKTKYQAMAKSDTDKFNILNKELVKIHKHQSTVWLENRYL